MIKHLGFALVISIRVSPKLILSSPEILGLIQKSEGLNPHNWNVLPAVDVNP